jgi:hypothetical protein
MEDATVQLAIWDEEATTVVVGKTVVKVLVISMALDKGARAVRAARSSCFCHRPMLLNS